MEYREPRIPNFMDSILEELKIPSMRLSYYAQSDPGEDGKMILTLMDAWRVGNKVRIIYSENVTDDIEDENSKAQLGNIKQIINNFLFADSDAFPKRGTFDISGSECKYIEEDEENSIEYKEEDNEMKMAKEQEPIEMNAVQEEKKCDCGGKCSCADKANRDPNAIPADKFFEKVTPYKLSGDERLSLLREIDVTYVDKATYTAIAHIFGNGITCISSHYDEPVIIVNDAEGEKHVSVYTDGYVSASIAGLQVSNYSIIACYDKVTSKMHLTMSKQASVEKVKVILRKIYDSIFDDITVVRG